MKIKQSIGLFALGLALTITSGRAQTTPTSMAPATGYPQGAIVPDSTPAKASRSQKRAMKQGRNSMNQNANSTTNTSTQDAGYRQSSASDGTAINNSNTTNYNSNNVTNAPTGVGSNPNSSPTTATPSAGNSTSTKKEATSDAGAVEAISGARTSETPAVKSGSTVRNTSIGDFMASSPNYTTLQNALQSADLSETLRGSGPYTIFAPSNTAFKKLPVNIQGGLLDGSNRAALKQLLSYHVVSGSLTTDELTRQIKSGNGKAQLKTLAGSTLTAQLDANGRVQLTDEQGGTAMVEGAENRQSNGVVYGISSVLMPKTGAGSFR